MRDTGEFESYMQDFEKSFEQVRGVRLYVDNISIKRGPLNKTQLALCEEGPGVSNITLNEMYWDKLSDVTKKIVF